MSTIPLLPLLEYTGDALPLSPANPFGLSPLPADLFRRYCEVGPDPWQRSTGAQLLYDQYRVNVRRLEALYGYRLTPDTDARDAAQLIAREYMHSAITPPNTHWLALWRWRLWRLTSMDPSGLPYQWPYCHELPKMHPFTAFLRCYPHIPWVYADQRVPHDDAAVHVRWRLQQGLDRTPAQAWWHTLGLTVAHCQAEEAAVTEAAPRDTPPGLSPEDAQTLAALAEALEKNTPLGDDLFAATP